MSWAVVGVNGDVAVVAEWSSDAREAAEWCNDRTVSRVQNRWAAGRPWTVQESDAAPTGFLTGWDVDNVDVEDERAAREFGIIAGGGTDADVWFEEHQR